jgi:hypothetical protein
MVFFAWFWSLFLIRMQKKKEKKEKKEEAPSLIFQTHFSIYGIYSCIALKFDIEVAIDDD